MAPRQLRTRKRRSSSERDRSESQLPLAIQSKLSSAPSQDKDNQSASDRHSPLVESGSILQRIWDRDNHTGRTGDSLPMNQLAIQAKLQGGVSPMMDEQNAHRYSAANALSQAIQAKALMGEQDPRSQQQTGTLSPQNVVQLKRGDITRGIFGGIWGGMKSGFNYMVDKFRASPNTPAARDDASTMNLTSPEIQVMRVLQQGRTATWEQRDIFVVEQSDRIPKIEIIDPLRYRVFAGFVSTEFAQESLLALILLKFLDWNSPEAAMAAAELFSGKITRGDYHYQSALKTPSYPVNPMSMPGETNIHPEEINVSSETLRKFDEGVPEYRAADEELTQAIKNNDGREAEDALNERKLQAWMKVMAGLNECAPQLSHLLGDSFSRFKSADGALEIGLSALPEFRSVNMHRVREYMELHNSQYYKAYKPRGVIKSKMKYRTKNASRNQQWYNDNFNE